MEMDFTGKTLVKVFTKAFTDFFCLQWFWFLLPFYNICEENFSLLNFTNGLHTFYGSYQRKTKFAKIDDSIEENIKYLQLRVFTKILKLLLKLIIVNLTVRKILLISAQKFRKCEKDRKLLTTQKSDGWLPSGVVLVCSGNFLWDPLWLYLDTA